jgi:signal peptidase I
MAPTIQAGDQIFANKFTYRFRPPRRGEVIVFTSPENHQVDFIKRIIAVGGDTGPARLDIRAYVVALAASRILDVERS